ncbi:MAG: hypothetical protein ACKOEO_06180, partial [Planctomycetaceae bacterium]
MNHRPNAATTGRICGGAEYREEGRQTQASCTAQSIHDILSGASMTIHGISTASSRHADGPVSVRQIHFRADYRGGQCGAWRVSGIPH